MKRILKLTLLISLLCLPAWLFGQTATGKKVFEIRDPDFQASPHTGMTRKHWKDAALYMLEGAFGYIKTLNDPMVFPKQPGKSYPNNGVHTTTEKLEGLCRTLFVAVPLLKENPALTINNINVADYYRRQLVLLTDPASSTYISPRAANGGANQNLVEFGGLAVSLFAVPEVIWDPLTQTQKDALAKTMLSYGDGPTIDSNWKFFNIFVLSFFKSKGYTVNENLLEEYLQKTLAHYRGKGWYNDNPAYDYYSKWAFQMYGPLWSEFFGKQYYPAYAAKFKENFSEVKNNYPYLFSRNGEMLMWGRSIAYRFAAIIPFPLMGLENDPGTNYGWMRRIASGTLLQFLQNPDFMAEDNIPTLGFYGAFEPAVQVYSCRGSAFWMGKAFLGLLVPETSPFWTATENEGAWEDELVKGKAHHKFQDGSNILITDYPNIGAAEVRAWCHAKVADDWQQFRSTENYNRLSYNSAFPWQADGRNGEVAMNYVVKNSRNEWEALRLYTFRGFEDGVYYRDAVLETNANMRFRLADIPLANGILRVDQNTSSDPAQIRLGHYALPHLNEAVQKETRKVNGREVQIIDNGAYQLAMVSLNGWDGIQTVSATGLHPVSKESSVLNVTDNFEPGQQYELYATLMLWKKSGETWTDEELVPVSGIVYVEDGSKIKVSFVSGDPKTVKLSYFAPVQDTGVKAGVYKITARHSGKVLQIASNSSANGALAEQWEFADTNSQKWSVEKVDGSLYKLTNTNSGKVLDLTQSSTVNGAAIQQWEWTNTGNQKWRIEDAGSGFLKIVSSVSGKGVDVRRSALENGGSVHQWDYWGGTNQQWTFETVSVVTGLEEETDPKRSALLKLFPNPAEKTTSVTFTTNQSGNTTLSLFNLNGTQQRVLFNAELKAQEQKTIQLNLSGLRPGIYLIRLISAGESSVQKLIVQ